MSASQKTWGLFSNGTCRAAILAIAAACLGSFGCSRVKPNVVPPNPPTVIVAMPVTREVTDNEEFVGQTAAEFTVEVRARVTGYLDKLNFVDGTEVQKNSVLFEIDPRSYETELARTEALLAQNEAHTKRLELDYKRGRTLRGRDVMPQEEYDKIEGDLAESKAMIASAKAARDFAKLNVDFTKVTAPISGLISRRMVDMGNLVKADDTLLTTIVSLDPMYVYFDIDERTLIRLRRLVNEGKVERRGRGGVPILGALADEDDFPHQGSINFSENRLDMSTGTLRVRAIMDNPLPTDGKGTRVLSPGMFMKVRLPVGVPRMATLVPEESIGTDQGAKFVFVVEEKADKEKKPESKGKKVEAGDPKTAKPYVVSQRPVKVGNLYFRNLREILSGIGPNDRVITMGLQRVRDGVPVTPQAAKPLSPGVAVTTAGAENKPTSK
jgi:multidrug efflux system membrane fusion protein